MTDIDDLIERTEKSMCSPNMGCGTQPLCLCAVVEEMITALREQQDIISDLQRGLAAAGPPEEPAPLPVEIIERCAKLRMFGQSEAAGLADLIERLARENEIWQNQNLAQQCEDQAARIDELEQKSEGFTAEQWMKAYRSETRLHEKAGGKAIEALAALDRIAAMYNDMAKKYREENEWETIARTEAARIRGGKE